LKKKGNGRTKHTLATAGFVGGDGDRLVLQLKRKDEGFIIGLRHLDGVAWRTGFLTNAIATESQARKEFEVRVEDAERQGWRRSTRDVSLTEIPAPKPAGAGIDSPPPPGSRRGRPTGGAVAGRHSA